MDALLPCNTEPKDDLVALLRRAQGGCGEAAAELFERCREPLRAVIRHVIQPGLRRLYDSDDFLIETFIRIFETNFTDEVLRAPETLWPYLKRIAENKVRDANRKYLVSQRHDLNRDVALESLLTAEFPSSKELSAEDVFLLKELVEDRLKHLIDQLPTMMQEIIRLLLEGATTREVASRLRVEPRRVYRGMEWLDKKVRELSAHD